MNMLNIEANTNNNNAIFRRHADDSPFWSSLESLSSPRP